jgi:hypothetical protein
LPVVVDGEVLVAGLDGLGGLRGQLSGTGAVGGGVQARGRAYINEEDGQKAKSA